MNLDDYINVRKRQSSEFRDNFDSGYDLFRFGVLVHSARTGLRWSRAELARRANIPVSAVTAAETQQGRLTFDQFTKIGAVFMALESTIQSVSTGGRELVTFMRSTRGHAANKTKFASA